MKNGYIIDTLTSVDICENVKMDGKVKFTKVLFIKKTLRYHHLKKF